MQGTPWAARLFADLPYPLGGRSLSLRDNFPCAAKSDERESGVRPLPQGDRQLEGCGAMPQPGYKEEKEGDHPFFLKEMRFSWPVRMR